MAATGSLLRDATKAFDELRQAYQGGQFDQCHAALQRLKRIIIEFPSFAPQPESSSTRTQEVVLARESMEYAVLLSAKQIAAALQRKDTTGVEKGLEDFGRNVLHLQTYYDDFNDVEHKSERQALIQGLNLLRLLAQRRLPEFYMALERISIEEHESIFIRDVIQLERFLAEGSYHKLLQARATVPSNEYIVFMDMLQDTVRSEIADGVARAYDQLSVAGAADLLMFKDDKQAAIAFAAGRDGWLHDGELFRFERIKAEDRTVPFVDVARQQLAYAHEMERIV
eukprot:TRINITY_DN96071_c0_g1_i1.p1 TRINITY_DN96071_c0_g1~~TRINITY_DN96071_c0_g1_i1.p1  ORF type:complete len:308 (-),score=72.79 TRINITY_DN96071_c0_g1_i1:8-856(-)